MSALELSRTSPPLIPAGALNAAVPLHSVAAVAVIGLFAVACHSPTTPSGPPVSLTVNVVDPASVNAVSMFNSCSGHAFPDGSPNSAKNYFWPNSTNFSTNGVLKEFAACDGAIGQNSNDTNPDEIDRGRTYHLYCDGSGTAVRYFHLDLAGGSGQHVKAGDFIGYAAMLGPGQAPSPNWQNSSNFDIAVVDGGDNNTEDYFSKLAASALAAWNPRGLSSVSQTINPGNPRCAAFTSGVGSPDVFSFVPPL